MKDFLVVWLYIAGGMSAILTPLFLFAIILKLVGLQ